MTAAADALLQASLIGDALDHAPVAVFVADDDMQYVAVNAYACELLGYTREELLGLRVTDVARYPEAREEYGDVVAHGRRLGTARLVRKDGGEVDLTYRASATIVAGMRFYVSIGWPTSEGGS